jgi:subtilisin family serine protease
MIRKRKECRLLPHIKQPIYGLSGSAGQIMPWSIISFDVPGFWKYSEGNNVTVAVIDTGCDLNHEDIKDNLVKGYNFIEINKDPIDRNGHGTHVAGTIAAVNNGKGIVGVAPKTKIMPIKALDDSGMGSNDNVAFAIMWAIENGADIITMSLGSEYPSLSIEKALIIAEERNVIVFCAAGNSGIKNDVNFPAKYNETISIGAVNKELDICEFSCSGDSLDFLAPGQDIISSTPGNSYSLMTGTSMATPFAVGCASLWLSHERSKRDQAFKFTKDEYINHFKTNALRLKDPKYSGLKRYEGNGIIQPKL